MEEGRSVLFERRRGEAQTKGLAVRYDFRTRNRLTRGLKAAEVVLVFEMYAVCPTEEIARLRGLPYPLQMLDMHVWPVPPRFWVAASRPQMA